MKKFLILQLRPEDVTADGEFEAILDRGGLQREETHRVRLEQAIPKVSLDEYAAVIVGGSPFDISTPEEEKSETQRNCEAFFKTLLTEILERDFPFLGTCSGNGLLGHQLKAPISRTYAETVMLADITLTKSAATDPLLVDVPKTFKALVGHKEACDTLPEGAVHLASGAACPMQMFRVGKNVYATQFHTEYLFEDIKNRIIAYKYNGYFDPTEADALIASLEGQETPHANLILRRFVSRYRV